MKKYVRFLCIVSALLMVLCTVSCADGGDKVESTTPPVSDTVKEDESSNEVEENRDYISDVSQDLKFKGREIRMLGLKKAGVEDELKSDVAHSSDIVADAIYARNLAISERLGIEIYVEMVEDVEASAETSVKTGGSAAFQIYTDQTNTACRTMTKNYLYNLNGIENLNIEKKYWSQGFNDIASYGEKQYLITGAPALSLYRYTYVTVYNKDYFKSAGWTDLYEVVNNKEWTLDYQFNLIKDVYEEQDGKVGISEGDFVGFVSGDTVSVDPYLTASGIHIIKKDRTKGNWIFDNTTLERVSILVDKLQDLYYNANGAYIYSSSSYDDTGLTYIADKFAAQEAAMATVQLYALEITSKQMDFMYGIVPMPKYDKGQENYYSYVQDQVTSMGILSNVPEKDLAMLGAFLDLFAYESYVKVVPEFYGKTLSYKMLKDQESLDMLHLIYETTEFDFVGAFSAMLPVAIRDQMRVQVAYKTNKVSSSFAQWKRQTEKRLDRIFEKLND